MESDALIYHREDKTKRNARTLAWHRGNPQRSYWLAAKGRANRQGLPFDIQPEDIVIPTTCPILGIKLISKKGGRTNNTPSLDRIRPEKGYVKGNVRVISWRANRLKNDASLEELEKIVKYYKKLDKHNKKV